ncbi:MAG: chemotaxis protein MotB [Cognaticolwellia sp.]|jgi:chemotaxis protein MotB
MKKHTLLIINVLIFIFITSCVSKKKYLQMEQGYVYTENTLQNTREIIKALEGDTSYLGSQVRQRDEKISDLKEYSQYSQSTLSKKLKELEMSIARKEFALAGRDRYLSDQAEKLAQKEKLLNKKTAQLNRLQNLINQQNSVLDTLRNIVTNSLGNFDDEYLNVLTKGGKVYISFSESLLFPKGKIGISKNGEDALKRLSEVLNNQPDIIITIEGHSDDKPIKSGIIRNNWDLSVLRAASVAEVLVKNGVYPWRVIPSGRSQYSPLVENITPEDRRLNRRTEIILSPNMRPLLKLLETQ